MTNDQVRLNIVLLSYIAFVTWNGNNQRFGNHLGSISSKLNFMQIDKQLALPLTILLKFCLQCNTSLLHLTLIQIYKKTHFQICGDPKNSMIWYKRNYSWSNDIYQNWLHTLRFCEFCKCTFVTKVARTWRSQSKVSWGPRGPCISLWGLICFWTVSDDKQNRVLIFVWHSELNTRIP